MTKENRRGHVHYGLSGVRNGEASRSATRSRDPSPRAAAVVDMALKSAIQKRLETNGSKSGCKQARWSKSRIK
jgi:hypothetical protein